MEVHNINGRLSVSCDIVDFKTDIATKLAAESDEHKVKVCKSVSGKKWIVMKGLKTIGTVPDDFVDYFAPNMIKVKQFRLVIADDEVYGLQLKVFVDFRMKI